MKRGALAILGCYVCWGILPVFWKQLEQVNSVYILAARVVWSLAFAAALVTLEHRWGAVRAAMRDRREWLGLTAAGIVVCCNWGSYIWAVNAGHLLDASLAYYMNPILTILLGTLVCKERLTKLQWLSVAVALTGVIIAVVRYRQVPWVALLIGGTFAIYGAIKKKRHTDAASSMFLETLLPTPVALAVLIVMERQGQGAVGVLTGWQWLLLPAAGVVTTVPLMLYAWGIRTTSLSMSGILMYVNPTLQLLLSVWVYHEAFTATHGILFGFVWTGLILYLLPDLLRFRRQQKGEVPCV